MLRRTLSPVGTFSLLVCCFVGCGSKDTPTSFSTPVIVSKDDALDVGTPWFEDVTAQSGITFQYRNGEDSNPKCLSILESLGGGLAVLDFDGDGLLDLFLVGGGHFEGPDLKRIAGEPCKLYRNLGSFRFEDVSSTAGLTTLEDGKPWFYSHGVAIADYDCDGWPDILVGGWQHLALFHNEPNRAGGRKFVDVSKAAGVDQGVTWATSLGWADFDGDGLPDFYACQYVNWSFDNHPACTYGNGPADVCPPKKFKGLKHLVFHNSGKGSFKNVSDTAGLVDGGDNASKGLGVVIVDVNGDGKPDVYVANDTVANLLYVNRSKPGEIRLTENGMKACVALDGFSGTNGSMGADAGDPERSGKPWLFCTNYDGELHALYKNQSTEQREFFLYATPGSGMSALGQTFVGWGTGFADIDHDGWEDVFIANGHAIRFPTTSTRRQKPVLMRNMGDAKFKIASQRGGSYFESQHLSRGLVLADFDNDGKTDAAIANVNENMAILRNISDDQHHWLGIVLEGSHQRDFVGAKVQVKTGTATQTRFAKGGGSYASSPDRRMVFGLAGATAIDGVTVTWPDGTRHEYGNIKVDGYFKLKQGENQAEAISPKK